MIYSRSGSRAVFSAYSSGQMNVTRNGEATVRSALVPAPNFMVGFKSAGSLSFDVSNPIRSSVPAARGPFSAPEAGKANGGPDQSSAVSLAAIEPADEAAPTEGRPAPTSESNSVELAIDSLPRFHLIKPIPVRVTPLGDWLFVASIPSLNISVTGDSFGEAVLLFKEHLISLLDNPRNIGSLDEQERQLQLIRSHVTETARKVGWFRS
jgi:hypothetical protein